MAGIDNFNCAVCETRIFYDGQVDYTRTGDAVGLCPSCLETHKITIINRTTKHTVKAKYRLRDWI